MSKYSMLLHHQDKDNFLEKLMNIGLVQISGYQTPEDAETEKLAAEIRETEEVVRRFKRRKVKINAKAVENTDKFSSLAEIAGMERDLEHAIHEAEALAIEIRLLEPWGEFNSEDIKMLPERTGFEAKFFHYPENRFKPEWAEKHVLKIINRTNGNLYFIIFRKPGEELPISPIALPGASLSTLRQQRAQCLATIDNLGEKLDACAANLTHTLQHRLEAAKDRLSLHIAGLKTRPVTEKSIRVIEAWCPAPVEKRLTGFLETEHIVFMRTSPDPGEAPPVLLKNNWFTRLFEPIGALFSLPRYSELDLTVFFAPFFLLFFGLCLGDAGYGLIILVLATAFKRNRRRPQRDYFSLAQLFGLSTIVAGFVSGTFFGIEMAHHETFSRWSRLFLNHDQLFNLALIIGFVQILFGMGIQVYKQWMFRGFLFALSKIGWIILLICLADIYVTELFAPVSRTFIWPGLCLIVFFGSPGKGWLQSFGLGLADLYNITGVLGDLLSYIRLFALSVSSAILGLVVNNMALSARDVPVIGIALYIIVLVVGHSANLLLSSLSAFVHPMRLTFVEFYKNSGFEGGGIPFDPFAKHHAKNKSSS